MDASSDASLLSKDGVGRLTAIIIANLAAERKLARILAKRAISQAGKNIGANFVDRAVAKAARKAALKAAAKGTAKTVMQITTKAAAGPAGWILIAVQAGGMIIDMRDPFNLARAYDESGLEQQHDMVATAKADVFANTLICTGSAQFTRDQDATATQPQVMGCDAGACVAMYQKQMYPNVLPPADASCEPIQNPSVLVPTMPLMNPDLPLHVAVLAFADSEDIDGAALCDVFAEQYTNGKVFADAAEDAEFRALVEANIVAQWKVAGRPLPPPPEPEPEPEPVDPEPQPEPPAPLEPEPFAPQEPEPEPEPEPLQPFTPEPEPDAEPPVGDDNEPSPSLEQGLPLVKPRLPPSTTTTAPAKTTGDKAALIKIAAGAALVFWAMRK